MHAQAGIWTERRSSALSSLYVPIKSYPRHAFVSCRAHDSSCGGGRREAEGCTKSKVWPGHMTHANAAVWNCVCFRCVCVYQNTRPYHIRIGGGQLLRCQLFHRADRHSKDVEQILVAERRRHLMQKEEGGEFEGGLGDYLGRAEAFTLMVGRKRLLRASPPRTLLFRPTTSSSFLDTTHAPCGVASCPGACWAGSSRQAAGRGS